MDCTLHKSQRVGIRSCIPILWGAAFLVLMPYALLLYTLPIGRDAGVFAYTGMIINSGGMPYVDSWDHKGPLLYLFNALGFLLTDSFKGIIFLEGMLLFASLFLSMCFWRRWLSTFEVLLAATMFALSYYATFELGNLTESWLIPFLLVTFSLAFIYLCDEDTSDNKAMLRWLYVAIGVTIAVAMMTRLNNVLGVGCLALYLLVFGTSYRIQGLAWLVISFTAISLPIVVWILQNGAMHAFIDQYWSFNFFYSNGASPKERMWAIYSLSKSIFFSPLGLACMLVSGSNLLSTIDVFKGKKSSFYCLMLMIFSVVFLSQMVSGRGYLHYASLATPSLALMLVTLMSLRAYPTSFISMINKNAKWLVFVVLVFLIAAAPAIGAFRVVKHGTNVVGSHQSELVNHLRQNTKPTDLVLIHGAETWLLAASGRRSATSITYYYPALFKFKNAHEQYQAEILHNQPLYIIEAPLSCGLSMGNCEGRSALFGELKDFQQKNYMYELDLNGYKFWRRCDVC